MIIETCLFTRVRVPDTNDCDADTDDADTDTDDDVGPYEDLIVIAKTRNDPCENRIVLAKLHSGASKTIMSFANP